ncbi:hypothetical protein N7462_008472 [Penicillium macrosclerotiorum]|uniref:uncharacterized protein n=1 Tax=Penicillium macrosclerotiorum TaxID=303699 RepID=UPI002549B435|nr:uncharacterized protein N7462_008472 [Penicillium macrosclerotiorum]KAJ5675575.1 hypothetical protein N7462_008472 [Penicillium macrosclerotiorum]
MSPAYRGLCGHLLLLTLALWLFLLPGQAYEKLSDETLRSLPRSSQDFNIYNGALLAPILIPRIPGTPGHTAVLEHFAAFFRETLPQWQIEFQNSTSQTPVSGGKDVPFINFIAYRDPPGASAGDVGRLTMVAHYDSKLEPEGFIGAIDSAAPCAMIMHAMRSIDAALDKKWAAMKDKGLDPSLEEQHGIQVLFLDGEEAFHQWSDTDSLYGARALAEHWDNSMYPAMSTFKTPLSSISLFVLLDLLGAKGPYIQSYYPTTHWAYQNLGSLEQRLRSLGQMKSTSEDPWFIDSSKDSHQIMALGGIQDDHLPFLAKGVEILHLIDFVPFKGFPPVWHTMDDDAEHLDMDTVEDWSILMTAFAAEWMELEGFLEHTDTIKRDKDLNEESEAIRLNKKTEL